MLNEQNHLAEYTALLEAWDKCIKSYVRGIKNHADIFQDANPSIKACLMLYPACWFQRFFPRLRSGESVDPIKDPVINVRGKEISLIVLMMVAATKVKISAQEPVVLINASTSSLLQPGDRVESVFVVRASLWRDSLTRLLALRLSSSLSSLPPEPAPLTENDRKASSLASIS